MIMDLLFIIVLIIGGAGSLLIIYYGIYLFNAEKGCSIPFQILSIIIVLAGIACLLLMIGLGTGEIPIVKTYTIEYVER